MTPSLAPTLQRLLDALPPADQLDFMRLWEALYQVRFTGPVTFDFLNGLPRQINLGQPLKLTICSGDPPPLDKPEPPDPPS